MLSLMRMGTGGRGDGGTGRRGDGGTGGRGDGETGRRGDGGMGGNAVDLSFTSSKPL